MNKRFLILLLLFGSSLQLLAQYEALVPMEFNPNIKQYLRSNNVAINSKTQSPGDTLLLPFIDDFSTPAVYPDANLWSDNLVFINTDLARNPPTIGVATFDGIDGYGNAYNTIIPATQGSCDTLTSRPINLSVKSAADTVYLSFFYEKKGWGDAPDNNDSLIVEFYRASSNSWVRQWFVKGGVSSGQDSTFIKVNIALLDTAFFKNGFRFRFRNYGSLTGALDLWHLDYVMLKDYSSGAFINDIAEIAYVNRVTSIIQPFTSMPWIHLKANQSPYNLTTLDTRYRNTSNTTTFFNINFRDEIFKQDGVSFFLDSATNSDILPFALNYRQTFISFVTLQEPLPPKDSTVITSTHMLSKLIGNVATVPDNIRTNDSVVFRYEFYNYYSYDDGTAEIGYDLVSAPGGKLAMRFDLAQADTLRAVRMLFVKQNLNVSNNLFTLKIWSSLSPETILYQQANLKPVYTDSVNGMATFVIPALPVSGTIYVGFQQNGPDGLHLGYDRNTKSNAYMSYNVNGTWNQVAVANGSFMIRIVMGDSNLFVGLNETPQNQTDVLVFPNPASDYIQCDLGPNSSIRSVSLYDAAGRLIFNRVGREQFRIDISNVPNGFYLLHFYNEDHQLAVTKKLMINH